MNSDTLPTASSPCPTDNAEVLSQEAPGRGETVPVGASRRPSGFREQREQGSRGLRVRPQPNTAPEPLVVPDSGRRPPSKRGKTPVLVTSVHPEAPDNLLGALRSASVDEEHRTIMSAVVQKVQSAKSGLTEACASLLTGFEVSI